ncbi:TM2 domain-containing protein [Thermoactinomyces daqus]|nr:TM2 domain-containing protein [Thermoactinomyces daqus]
MSNLFTGDLSMQNSRLRKDLNTEQLLFVNSELERKGKKKSTAYLLWFFLGNFGAHRFYVGDVIQGILMLLTLGLFGIWTLIDAFLLYYRIEDINAQIEHEAIMTIGNK